MATVQAVVIEPQKPAEIPVAVATAVPVMPVAQAVPIAQPMAQPVAQPMGYQEGGANGEDFKYGEGYTPVQPSGRWKSELCECAAAGFGMCCVSCCCSFISIGQLYEKVLGKPGACMKILPVLFIFWLMYQLGTTFIRMTPAVEFFFTIPGSNSTFSTWNYEEGEERGLEIDRLEVNPMFMTWAGVSFVGSIGLLIISTCLLQAVRKRIREKDNITHGCCGESEDCCCAFWCGCCMQIQIFKQINMQCDTGYQLCSPEGVPTERASGPDV